MPGLQVQEINIHWDHITGPYPSKGIHGAQFGKVQWRYLSLDRQELQPFLQGYLSQADWETHS